MAISKESTGGMYQEHFKRNGKWVDDAALLRFVQNGITEALTLEEIQEKAGYKLHLNAFFSCWMNSGKTYADGSPDRSYSHERYGFLESSDEVMTFLQKVEQRMAARQKYDDIFPCLSYPFEKREWSTRPAREKKVINRNDSHYVIRFGSSSYV